MSLGCWQDGLSKVRITCSSLVVLSEAGPPGKLRVDVDSVHGFDRDGVMAAYRCIGTGKAKGKVVVRAS